MLLLLMLLELSEVVQLYLLVHEQTLDFPKVSGLLIRLVHLGIAPFVLAILDKHLETGVCHLKRNTILALFFDERIQLICKFLLWFVLLLQELDLLFPKKAIGRLLESLIFLCC
jgi:hypothetical protein